MSGLEPLKQINETLLEVSAQELKRGVSAFPGKALIRNHHLSQPHLMSHISLFPQVAISMAAHQSRGGILLFGLVSNLPRLDVLLGFWIGCVPNLLFRSFGRFLWREIQVMIAYLLSLSLTWQKDLLLGKCINNIGMILWTRVSHSTVMQNKIKMAKE